MRRLTAAALAATTTLLGATPAAAVDLGVFSGPVRFSASDGATIEVDDRRYVGTVEARVGRAGGVTVIDELSTDAYLEGLAEVPVSWPDEALRAQVVAARTYAWWELSQGAWTDAGFDLCGTQACQVFAGRDVVEADPSGRWAAAVAATSGEVLLDADGQPMLARFSSANGGASVPNVEVFPDDGDPPYLQRVEDPFDVASPFNRWRVRIDRDDLDLMLARDDALSTAVPHADVRLVEVPRGEDLVVVTGRDGTEAAVTATEFRFLVVRTAPEVAPDRYPRPRADDPARRMPATLLSQQMAFTVTDEELVVDGRGFGHGVGMSQYGALGRAEAGQDHAEILAAYYGSAPTTTPALPDTIRVGFVEDAPTATLRLTSPVPVTVGDTLITERGIGTWTIAQHADRTLRLVAPDGFGAPLVVDPTTAVADTAAPAGVVRLQTVVNKPVELVVEVRDQGGELVAEAPAGVVDPGRHSVDWSVASGVPGGLPAGRFGVALVAVDEDAARAGAPTPVEVVTTGRVAAVLSPPPGAAPPVQPRPQLAAAAAVGLVLGGSLAALVGRTRRARSTRRTPSESP